MTDDFGQTWKPITANLPVGSSRCLREDVTNPNLLYCGTPSSRLFVSLRPRRVVDENQQQPADRGRSRGRSSPDRPGEIVAATHGRSLWILDVTALRQMASEKIKDEPTLYKPNTVVRWQRLPQRGRSGRQFTGENPAPGAHVFYSLPLKAEKVTLEFQDIDGKKVGEVERVPTGAGLHKVTWNTATSRRPPPAAGASAASGKRRRPAATAWF